MNPGQVRVTLTRLEKAAPVASEQAEGLADRPDRKVCALTPAGQARVAEWLAEVSWPAPDLAQFHIKLVAAAAGLADPRAIVDVQRGERCGGCATDSGPPTSGSRPPQNNPGLVWLTQADVRSLTPDPDSVSYVMNLKLADPNQTQAFVNTNHGEHGGTTPMQTWENILEDATEVAGDSQILLLIGAWLLGLLAVASLSVLVGGRMADQRRRVGLLKAVGGTPSLVAAVLLAEYVSWPSSRPRPGWRSDR